MSDSFRARLEPTGAREALPGPPDGAAGRGRTRVSDLSSGSKPTEARDPLRRALELAEACGAQPLSEHVRAEIHATGARPRTTALHGVLALTTSERRVADLAAGGQTNRDIAQSLYVTPKTVEVHLTNAYRKLGIGSRRDLPRVLAKTP